MHTRTRGFSWRRHLASLVLLLVAGAPAHADERVRAEAAVKDLGQQLRAALVARMQADGPVAAIDFCHDQAPVIAASVADTHGVRIGRTSLRTRSAANAPTSWQQAVLLDFQARSTAGEPVQTLRYAGSEPLPAGTAFRYMQGIPIEAPCLVCHGTALAEPVAQAIQARYPGDAATGYSEGELRGAFWAEVPAAAAKDSRAVIEMSESQREELRAQMRAHLDAVQAILAATAASDWDAVARAAEAFGPGRGQGRGPAHGFRSALPDGWFSFARPMHQAMRAIADEAGTGKRSAQVVAGLAQATAQCTACHASFRVQSR
ncbi:MAG: DUF3365 domain-containing protein [Rhodanobacteraceae bacterium]|nr:DUF3365 domain-containing protein [Rhodanobacteraceae bacterium]